MKNLLRLTVTTGLCLFMTQGAIAGHRWDDNDRSLKKINKRVQLGPRPFYLLDQLRDGELKKDLQRCATGRFATRQAIFR